MLSNTLTIIYNTSQITILFIFLLKKNTKNQLLAKYILTMNFLISTYL